MGPARDGDDVAPRAREARGHRPADRAGAMDADPHAPILARGSGRARAAQAGATSTITSSASAPASSASMASPEMAAPSRAPSAMPFTRASPRATTR